MLIEDNFAFAIELNVLTRSTLLQPLLHENFFPLLNNRSDIDTLFVGIEGFPIDFLLGFEGVGLVVNLLTVIADSAVVARPILYVDLKWMVCVALRRVGEGR